MFFKVEFPLSIEPFRVYESKKQFIEEIKESCHREYGNQLAFQYEILKSQDQSLSWQCKKPMCVANFVYRYDTELKSFRLFQHNPIHKHSKQSRQKFSKYLTKQFEDENKISFVFPKTFDGLTTCKGKEDILQKLRALWSEEFPNRKSEIYSFDKKPYSRNQIHRIYVYCRLDICNWGLAYFRKQNDDLYHLYRKSQDHVHPNYELQVETNKIFPELYEAYSNLDESDFSERKFKEEVQKKIGLNFSQFIRLLRNYEYKNGLQKEDSEESIEKLISSLKNYKYEVIQGKKNPHDDSNNEVILVVSKLMSFLFKSYGRVIYCQEVQIVETHTILPNSSIYVFSGFNHNFNHVIYGIGLCRKVTVEKLEILISTFFNRQGLKNQCVENQTLVLEKKSKMIIEAVKNLRKANSKVKFMNVIFFFKQCLYNKKDEGIEENDFVAANVASLKLLNSTPRPNYQECQQFLSHCLAAEKETFVGLRVLAHKSLGADPIKHMTKGVLENGISMYQEFNQIFKKVLQNAERINLKWYQNYFQNSPAEDYIYINELKKCRISMSRRPFQELILEINRLPSLNIIYYDHELEIYLVDNGFYPYTVHCASNSSDNQKWICECYLKEKKGIPCCHILKVLICFDKSIFKQIHPFWLIDMGIMNLQKTKEVTENQMDFIKRQALAKNNWK